MEAIDNVIRDLAKTPQNENDGESPPKFGETALYIAEFRSKQTDHKDLLYNPSDGYRLEKGATRSIEDVSCKSHFGPVVAALPSGPIGRELVRPRLTRHSRPRAE